MNTRSMSIMVGLSLTIGAQAAFLAQTQYSPNQPYRSAKQRRRNSDAATVRRSGLPPGIFVQEPPRGPLTGPGNENGLTGDRFTSSSTRSVTRAGEVGVITGTAGSDVNGQVGTTNQGNLVDGPMGGIFTSHFGSDAGAKRATIRAHRSPRAKQNEGP